MSEVGVETGVDRLVDFLKLKGKLSLRDVSKGIKVPESTLQLWVEFLVEEGVLGIEYKFTKPYIFLNDKTNSYGDIQEDETVSIETFKLEFFETAKEKLIPESKIPALWKKHLEKAILKQKTYFKRESAKRHIVKSDELFETYRKKLLAI